MTDEIRIPVTRDADLVPARAEGRALARRLGFSSTDATLLATAISEVARNIVVHAGSGELVMHARAEPDRHALVIVARDDGPGIRDIEGALTDGFASRGGLGLGLPGARRLMDEFRIESAVDHGTTVTMIKWRAREPRDGPIASGHA